MDVFNEEFILFWSALNEFKVKYIMIGGVATNLHGYQRTTNDIDVWIEDTPSNRSNLRKAMKQYTGMDYFMIDTMQIIPGWTNFYLNNGFRLDFMVDVKGLEEFTFDESLSMASIADIEEQQVPFLHINQLIASKKAANRSKDQVDVIYLEKIKELLSKGKNT